MSATERLGTGLTANINTTPRQGSFVPTQGSFSPLSVAFHSYCRALHLPGTDTESGRNPRHAWSTVRHAGMCERGWRDSVLPLFFFLSFLCPFFSAGQVVDQAPVGKSGAERPRHTDHFGHFASTAVHCKSPCHAHVCRFATLFRVQRTAWITRPLAKRYSGGGICGRDPSKDLRGWSGKKR